jgi:exopolysaccharide biosynthesis polyprenyl glycosylphosphotransferase
MDETSEYIRSDVGEPAAAMGRMHPFDVRLRREITHRRLVVSMLRRLLRVISLHALDGALLWGVVTLLARAWAPFVGARLFAPAIVAIFLLSLNALSAYDPGDGRRDERRLLSGTGLALLILLCLAIFPPHLPLAPEFLLMLGGTGFTALALGRKLVDQVVRQAYAHGIGLRRAAMIGSLDEVGRAIRQLRDDRNIDQYLVGHLSVEGQPDPTALGAIPDLPRLLDELDLQEIIITTALSPALTRWVAECCFERGAALYVVPPVADAVQCRAEPLRVGAWPLLRLHPARLEFPALLAKRGFDLIIATVLLVLTTPLMLLIAAAIRLESPGAVFYKARRVGLGGRTFRMWKFRSMYTDAEEREKDLAHLNIYPGGTFKIQNDPRVTRVGRLLRRTSLDELPQLFNVLRGNMSLVGPRPALPADLDRYEAHHFERLSVIPGMTGPWQVGGRNLITDFDTIVRMERAYIRSWSLFVDVKIILRTFRVVVSGEGAY